MAEIVSAVLGFVLGGIVMWLWTALGRWLGDDRFWSAFQQLARDLVAGAAPNQLLRQYVELLRLLAVYVGKMTCRVGVAVLPVVLCCTLLGPFVFQAALHRAQGISVFPVQSAHITFANRSLTFPSANGKNVPVTVGSRSLTFKAEGPGGLLHEIERFAPLQITTPAFEVVVPQWTAPVAVSNSPWRCLGLTLLGMDARQVAAGPPLLIVRPSLGDANPLSPYLSDVELSFWAGLLSASLIAGLALRRSEKGIRPK